MVANKVMSDQKGKPCVELLGSAVITGDLFSLPAIRTAVVHPVDVESLPGAIEAANAGLINPLEAIASHEPLEHEARLRRFDND